MPYNFLLCNCLLPGKTSISESRNTAQLKREEGECVLAFALDTDHVRDEFGMSDGMVCDGLFFYWLPKKRPVTLLVELKGSDFGRAVDQLASTLTRLRSRPVKLQPQVVAVVVSQGGAPAQWRDICERFHRQHKVLLKHSKTGNLRDCLPKSDS